MTRGREGSTDVCDAGKQPGRAAQSETGVIWVGMGGISAPYLGILGTAGSLAAARKNQKSRELYLAQQLPDFTTIKIMNT